MTELKQWAAMLCLAALGCTALQQVIPKQGTGKLFRLVISTFFLCCLMVPVLKITCQLSLPAQVLPDAIVSEELDKRVTEQLKRQVESAVELVAEEALNNRQVVAKKIKVTTDTRENGSIYIQHIDIFVDKQHVPAALVAENVLEKQLDTEVNILTE